jgi:hypothetical protein
MILLLYRLLCAYLSVVIVRGLLGEGRTQEKLVMALLLVPLVLRCLLIK